MKAWDIVFGVGVFSLFRSKFTFPTKRVLNPKKKTLSQVPRRSCACTLPKAITTTPEHPPSKTTAIRCDGSIDGQHK